MASALCDSLLIAAESDVALYASPDSDLGSRRQQTQDADCGQR
jgi:hypothetical protein